MEKTKKLYDELVELVNNIDCDNDSKKELKKWVNKSLKNMERIEFKYQRVTTDKSVIDNLLNKTSEDLQIALLKAEHKSEKLQTILETTPAAIYVKDKDGNISEKNIEYESLTSKLNNPDELLDYIKPYEDESIRENNSIKNIEFQSNSDFYRIKISPFYNNENEFLGIVVVIVDISELKQKEQDLISSINISREANRAKDQFLANMSHEIRTPMNAIMGMSEYLLRQNVGSEIHDSIRKINRSSENLLYIINDILDFSKLASGKFEIEIEEFTLEDLIESVIDNCETRLENSNVNLVIETEENIPFSLCGGYYRLIQILTNLLSNALKFTDDGVVKLRVCSDKKSKNNYLFLFEVSDTGIGMSESQKENLFQPFSQVDFSDTRKYGGTGLGLAITKRLIDQMGGEINYESQVGEGTQFSVKLKIEKSKSKKSKLELLPFDKTIHFFTPEKVLENNIRKIINIPNLKIITHESLLLLPETELQNSVILIDINFGKETIIDFLKLDNSKFIKGSVYILQNPNRYIEKIEDPIVSDVIVRKPLTPLKIAKIHSPEAFNNDLDFENYNKNLFTGKNLLVVDDNDINIEVATNLLSEFGINNDSAENGQVALDLLKKNNYDLILLDLHMPILNGYDTIKKIREFDKDIPVIALTADAIIGMKEKVISHGFNDLITKPYKGVVFLEKIKTLLLPNGKSSEESLENYIECSEMIETTNTLELLSNSYDLYKGLLLKYYLKFQNIINQIESEYLENKETYFKSIHQLKGVLGTLGAINLYNLLCEIEKNREDPTLLEIHQKDLKAKHSKFLEFIKGLENY